MKTNPYEYSDYDKSIPWIPQQNQLYAGGYASAYPGQQQAPVSQNQVLQAGGRVQKPKPPKPMPKARAQAMAATLKRWLVVASLLGFGTFSGLAAFHQIGNTTTASQSTSNSSSGTTSTSNSSTQNNNGFFNQQGGNNLGSSNTSSGSNSSSQAPVSGSGVS